LLYSKFREVFGKVNLLSIEAARLEQQAGGTTIFFHHFSLFLLYDTN